MLMPEKTKKQVRKRISKTISMRRLKKLVVSDAVDYDPQELAQLRPQKRSECINGPRPCPWVGCKYNLYLDVNPRTGSIILNFPDKEPWEIEDSCVLDIADRGPVTLEEIGKIMNLTRERIRQLETGGIKQLHDDSDISLEYYDYAEVEILVPDDLPGDGGQEEE